MKGLVPIIWLTVTVVLCAISYKSGKSTAVANTDTVVVVKWDTMHIVKPVAAESKPLGLRSYRLKLLGRVEEFQAQSFPNLDELERNDSVEVELPITQKVYEDSTYKAYVSGFDARLDSIILYPPTRYITIATKENQSSWSWGLQAGVGITPKGVQPYIGAGVQKRF